MKKLNILVEGQTEERFIKQVIYPHLLNFGIKTFVECWFTNRSKGSRGGGGNYDFIHNHLSRWIKQEGTDKDVFYSVMIDLYKFPRQGNTIYDEEVAKQNGGLNKVKLLESKMIERIGFYRFVPYIQLHEFEALLFANPQKLEVFYTDKKKEIAKLTESIGPKPPEELNDTPEGAPSKRIEKFIPIYSKQKATVAPLVANSIGLNVIRNKCPHFNEWLTKLELIK